MANIFSEVQKPKLPRTAFNLSHEVKLTADLGKLIPVLTQEVVPGDHFSIQSEMMCKLAPLIFPIMHRVDVYIHYFFVPNRLLWDDWQAFITGDKQTVCPTWQASGSYMTKGKLPDYLGLPAISLGTESEPVNDLPFRAYYKIWNDYYRDENLQDEINLETLDSYQHSNLLYRSWTKDYFTSALPWAQKGDPVKVPLGGKTTWKQYDPSTGNYTSLPDSPTTVQADKQGSNEYLVVSGASAGVHLSLQETDLDVNDLRLVTRLQRWLERNARAGSRYVEHLLAHWGIISKDASLQRAEYIGGGAMPIIISDVLQHSKTDGTAYLGTPAGHGIGVGNQFRAQKFCDEHGFIMAIMSIVPKPAYYQGMPKMFSRETNLDFYFPEFANLGEQAIKNREIYFGLPSSFENDKTFGYQSRYAEYKYSADRVCGDYRDTLEAFHLGRKFDTLPRLNSEFITMEAEAPTLEERVFAAGRDAHPFWIQLYHNIIAKRPMPYYGTPQL